MFRSDDITLLACIAIVGAPVMAVSTKIMLRAATDALLRVRGATPPAEMQREIEDLRAQVERMSATEAFYARLQTPSAEAGQAVTAGS